MLRRLSLILLFSILCFTAFLFFTPWSQEALAVAPQQAQQVAQQASQQASQQANRLKQWMASDEDEPVHSPVPAKHEKGKISSSPALNWTKVATMIETRDSPMLIPILLSWLANVPGDWPFVIWTSAENHQILSEAACFQHEIRTGRLNFTRIDSQAVYKPSRETSTLSDTLCNDNWFWTQFQPEAEWMLFFQIDAVPCSKSGQSWDDWLGYDFIGAPCFWTHCPHCDRMGGNGGLSMRRISAMRQITTENPRQPGQEPEDVWFTRRLQDRKTTRWPEREGRATYQFAFSQGWMEDESIDEAWKPLGIHHGGDIVKEILEPGPNGTITNKVHRILESCPEFLYLRYALDEYREIDYSEWAPENASQSSGPGDASTSAADQPGMSDLSTTSLSIEDVSAHISEDGLHDLTPIFAELIEAGLLNATTSTTEQDPSHFSSTSDDIHAGEAS